MCVKTDQKEFITNTITLRTMTDVILLANVLIKYDWLIDGKVTNISDYGYKFTYNNRKRAAGVCNRRKRTIELSEIITKINLENPKFIENTIRHEIAHAIDNIRRGRSNHDNYWQSILLQMGGDGKRCFDVNDVEMPTNYKFTYTCPNGHSYNRHRRSKRMENVSCGKCSNVFDPKYKFKVIQNF